MNTDGWRILCELFCLIWESFVFCAASLAFVIAIKHGLEKTGGGNLYPNAWELYCNGCKLRGSHGAGSCC